MSKGKRKILKNKIVCLVLLLCLLVGYSEMNGVVADSKLIGETADAKGNNGRKGAQGSVETQEVGFSLTLEEEGYLEQIKNRTIIFGVSEASAYSEKDGVAYGTFVPVLEVLEEIFGLKVEVVSHDWTTNRELFFSGEIDFLYGLPAKQGADRMEEGTLISSTEWLYINPMYLVAKREGSQGSSQEDNREGSQRSGQEDNREGNQESSQESNREGGQESGQENRNSGMRLGLLGGFLQAEEIADYLNPTEIIRFVTPEEMLQGLYEEQVDALIVAESFQESLFGADGIEVAEDLSRFASYTAFATAKEECRELIELFNRYLAENMVSGETEGKQGHNLREEIQSEKKNFWKNYIMETEAAAIQAVEEEYEVLRYAFSSSDSMPLSYQWENERIGIFESLMSFITFNTGLSFEKRSMTGADAAAALDENEIQLLVGELSRIGDRDGDFSFISLLSTRLVPVSSIEEPFGKEQVGYHYWGVEENYTPLLEGTIFDSRSIPYESKEEVLRAYQDGEVGGILLKEGCLDYDRLAAGKEKYKAVEGISIPAREGVSFNKANEGLNALIQRLVATYRLVCREDIERWEMEEKSYYLAILEDYAPQKKELLVWRIAGIVLAGLLLLSLFGRNEKKKKGQKKKQKNIQREEKGNAREELWKTGKGRVATQPEKGAMEGFGKGRAVQSNKGTVSGFDKRTVAQGYGGRTRRPYEWNTGQTLKKTTAGKLESKTSAKTGEIIKNSVTEEIDSILSAATDGKLAAIDGRSAATDGSSAPTDKRLAGTNKVSGGEGKAISDSSAMRAEDGADALTGLLGEHSGRKRIEEILRQYPQAQAVFSYLDLRKLKQVNHTYGYRVGDEVLVSFAKSLKTLELDQDTVVFRVDGDKFGAFRGNLQTELDYQLYLGELQSLSAQARADGKLIYVSYCCSAAVYKKDADDLKGLMKCADTALYTAKKKGLTFAAWEEGNSWRKKIRDKRKRNSNK